MVSLCLKQVGLGINSLDDLVLEDLMNILEVTWNMLEPCFHWWRYGDLMFHVLIKHCMCALYLD